MSKDLINIYEFSNDYVIAKNKFKRKSTYSYIITIYFAINDILSKCIYTKLKEINAVKDFF